MNRFAAIVGEVSGSGSDKCRIRDFRRFSHPSVILPCKPPFSLLVINYGFYSNKSRGLRKKTGVDNQVPALIESEASPKEFRKNWARLIQKIYNVDPLLCPKCLGSMKIISIIEDGQIIEKILRHLGLWETRNHDPPAESAAHIPDLTYDDSYSQLLPTDSWLQ